MFIELVEEKEKFVTLDSCLPGQLFVYRNAYYLMLEEKPEEATMIRDGLDMVAVNLSNKKIVYMSSKEKCQLLSVVEPLKVAYK